MKEYTYKDTGIEWLGEIPEHWKVDRIKDKTTNVIGGDWGDDPTSDEEGKVVVVLRVADLDGIYFNYDDPTYRKISDTSWKSRKIDGRTLLIEKSGGGENQNVGRVGFPKGLSEEAICSNFMALIKLEETVDLRFFNYTFNNLYNNDLNYPFVQQTTGIQNLNVGYYLTTKIPLPSPPEQKAIADYLDTACQKIDRMIKLKEKQIEKIEEHFKQRVYEATTKGLKESVEFKKVNSEWIGEIPAHWEVKKIKRFCKIFRGKFTHRPRNDPDYYNGEYPFIQTGSVTNAGKYINEYTQTLNEKGLSVSELFPSGTLTMTIAANIGDVAILNFEACFPDSVVGFKPDHNMNIEYLFYLFKAIRQDFLSTAIVTTQLNLNIVRIGNVEGFKPPLPEQKEIVNRLNSLARNNTEMKERLKNQINILKNYRKSLIHECVTGKKKVFDGKIVDELVIK